MTKPSSEFFENKSCKYYPCHDMKEINCLFCFCPLFFLEYPEGKADCSNCGWPHKPENYDLIMQEIIKRRDMNGL
jgi:Zn-finger protein